MFSSRIAVLLFVFVVCLASLVAAQPDRSMARLLADREGLPLNDAMYRFFASYSAPQKRNNAEVVNHILKNFGTLDRLGDVGK